MYFYVTNHYEVPFPLDDKTKRLIKWMTKAMYQHHGIGLAAIQVGYQQRMFVMDCSRSKGKGKVFINPEIVEKSDETLRDSWRDVYQLRASREM